jgi:hypothetical protein
MNMPQTLSVIDTGAVLTVLGSTDVVDWDTTYATRLIVDA